MTAYLDLAFENLPLLFFCLALLFLGKIQTPGLFLGCRLHSRPVRDRPRSRGTSAPSSSADCKFRSYLEKNNNNTLPTLRHGLLALSNCLDIQPKQQSLLQVM